MTEPSDSAPASAFPTPTESPATPATPAATLTSTRIPSGSAFPSAATGTGNGTSIPSAPSAPSVQSASSAPSAPSASSASASSAPSSPPPSAPPSTDTEHPQNGNSLATKPVPQWDSQDVITWLQTLPTAETLAAYAPLFRSHHIAGDVLPYLTAEDLKDMGIGSLPHRLLILKHISTLAASRLEAPEVTAPYLLGGGAGLTLAYGANQKMEDDIGAVFQQLQLRDTRLFQDEASIQRLSDSLAKLRDDLRPVLKKVKEAKPLPTPEGPLGLSSASPGSHALNYPNSESATSATLRPSSASSASSMTSGASPTKMPPSGSSHGTETEINRGKEAEPQVSALKSEPLKQLRASTDDSCSKVLHAAMKRHGLLNDGKRYALVICYGDQERILALDEKPVVIFRELQEQGKHPAIMLRQMEESSH